VIGYPSIGYLLLLLKDALKGYFSTDGFIKTYL